jgi:hypothetical protein
MNHVESLEKIPEIDYHHEFDGKNLNDYLRETLMNTSQDAMSFLLYVIPIVLRININIVKINENEEVKDENDRGFIII